MAVLGGLLGPRRVAIFARPPVPDPSFGSRLIAFILSDAVIEDPSAMSFDTSPERQHSRRYNWTRSPVERATTDNAIRQPDTVTIRGSLSPNPAGGILAVLGAFGGIVRRDRETIDKLRRIADRRLPVVAVTPERNYSSMGMEVIDERHGKGRKIDVTVRMSEVTIVSPMSVLGELDINALNAGVDQEVNLGGQSTQVVADPGGLG